MIRIAILSTGIVHVHTLQLLIIVTTLILLIFLYLHGWIFSNYLWYAAKSLNKLLVTNYSQKETGDIIVSQHQVVVEFEQSPL